MIIELLFDEKIYRKQMQLLYDLAYKRKLKYYKNSHYLGFALSIIGVFMIIDKRNVGYVLILFGLGIIIPYFSVYFKHISMSKKFLLEQNETIKVYKEHPKSIWEFTEEFLKYSDSINEKTIEWKDFLTYTVVEDTIFMFTKTFEPLVIGKTPASASILLVPTKKINLNQFLKRYGHCFHNFLHYCISNQ